MRVAEGSYSFGDFSNHTSIDFDSNNFFAPFQERCCQITRTGSNFQHDICRLDRRFLNDLLHHEWILQNMLTEGLVESEVVALLIWLLHDCPFFGVFLFL